MSIYGKILKISTFGESHSENVGCILEGFPSNYKIDQEYIQFQLDRRRPGQSHLSTQRKEQDQVKIISGIENGVTLGSPICMIVKNEDYIKKDYKESLDIPRPGHADYTYQQKYGIKAESGGGRSSARETVGRVCGGGLCKYYLEKQYNIKIKSFVQSIGEVELENYQLYFDKSEQEIEDLGTILTIKDDQKGQVYFKQDLENGKEQWIDCFSNLVKNDYIQEIIQKNSESVKNVYIRCPNKLTALKMAQQIEIVRNQKDSIGGIIATVIQGLPTGLGEPVFDKLSALLAHAMLSIPATKGFEYGSGFQGTKMRGSQHNDTFISKKDSKNNNLLTTSTNNAGGMLGGISNGNEIYFRVAFKPVSTIGLPQETVDFQGNKQILENKGRHDPCVLPRAPPIIDSMAALTILDSILIQKAKNQ